MNTGRVILLLALGVIVIFYLLIIVVGWITMKSKWKGTDALKANRENFNKKHPNFNKYATKTIIILITGVFFIISTLYILDIAYYDVKIIEGTVNDISPNIGLNSTIYLENGETLINWFHSSDININETYQIFYLPRTKTIVFVNKMNTIS